MGILAKMEKNCHTELDSKASQMLDTSDVCDLSELGRMGRDPACFALQIFF